MNKLVPTEKYLKDVAEHVGDDEEAPVFEAHRRMLARLAEQTFDCFVPWSGRRRFVREVVDADHELHASVILVREDDDEIRVELRGIKRAPRGSYLF